MKSHRLSTYTRIALIAAIAGVMTACVSNPHYYDRDPYYSTRVTYYDYWYYPAIGAYYDPHARIYIYYEHDHWIRARALPPRMRTHLGHYVTVRSPHDRPYEEHHRHRQQYQPERYREREHNHRGDDAWIGAPHQQSPQRDRYDRRIESRDPDRNGKDRRHAPERGAVSVPPRYREPDVKYPRQNPDTRPKDFPRHREPPASTAPIQREDKWRQPEIRRERSPGQYRTPDSRGQHTQTPPQAAPGHREQPTRTAPAKQDDKRHQREKQKEDTKHRNREGDDRPDNVSNDDDATPQKRRRSQFDRYEQYR